MQPSDKVWGNSTGWGGAGQASPPLCGSPLPHPPGALHCSSSAALSPRIKPTADLTHSFASSFRKGAIISAVLISPPSHLPHSFAGQGRMRRYAVLPPYPNPYPSQSGDGSTVPPLRWLFQPGRDKGTEPGRGHPHVLLLGVPGGSSLPGAPRELPFGEGRGAQRLLRAVRKGVWGDPGGPRLRARLCPRAAI